MELGRATLRQKLGIQLQETQLAEKLTVFETLRLFRSFFRQGPGAEEAIRIVQLEEKRDARVGALSGGQKQRLALACALVGDPDLLFLDEPTTGLDPQARRQLWELIEEFKAAGRTILLTTHYMDEAERLCDRVAIMDHGKIIAQGTPRELIASIGVEHVVEFSAGGNVRWHVDLAGVRGMSGVRDVRSENGSVLLQVTELHKAVPGLLEELGRQGVPLTELRTHSATLEDVFVHLTGGICAMNKRGFMDHALVQLTLMRMREFIREPEALFWSMIFPIALAAGLGIAFRNRPPEVLKVAAVTPRLAEALRQEKLLDVMQLPPQLAEQFVRTGKVALVAEPAAGRHDGLSL